LNVKANLPASTASRVGLVVSFSKGSGTFRLSKKE
jgi:hypothetical protein